MRSNTCEYTVLVSSNHLDLRSVGIRCMCVAEVRTYFSTRSSLALKCSSPA